MEKVLGLKHVVCHATVDDERKRENLCECINILGGVARINGNDVSVDYEGSNTLKMVELFEQYFQHGIYTES